MKKLLIIAFIIGMGTAPIHSERVCLWIGVLSAGAVVSTVVGGLLGYYFPLPLGSDSSGNTAIIGASGGFVAYHCLMGAAASAKACYDGVCCND